MKLPKIKDLKSLFVAIKNSNHFENDTQVTIGWEEQIGSWSYQTGDNSFMGSAYYYPHWAIVYLDKRSNSTELARDVRSQLAELVA